MKPLTSCFGLPKPQLSFKKVFLVNSRNKSPTKIIKAKEECKMKLEVTAPGKIILTGEHSVVYGKTAVAVSLDLKTTFVVEDSKCNELECNFKDLDSDIILDSSVLTKIYDEHQESEELVIKCVEEYINDLQNMTSLQQRALVAIASMWILITRSSTQRRLSPLKFIVTSSIPVGAGLGSSASFSVCLVCSLLVFCRIINDCNSAQPFSDETLHLINGWAFKSESIFHGRPSGIDNTICTHGGAVVLKDGQKSIRSDLMELRILIINSGVSRDTRQLVQNVKNLRVKFPDVIDAIMDSMDHLSSRIIEMLFDGTNDSDLKDLVKINQNLLSSLGVSHHSIDCICRIANKHNFEAKLTGAGGGGCAFVVLQPDAAISSLVAELESSGYKCWDTCVGRSGVTITIMNHEKS